MRSRNIHRVFILLTALFIVILGSGAAFAQRKGHGNNKGGGENRGGGQREQQRQNEQSKAPRNERPQFQQREQRQEQRGQQRNERPQIQREAQRIPPGWQKQEHRQQDGRNEQRRQEVRQIPNWPRYEPQQNNGEARKQRHNEGDWKQDHQRQFPSSNAWPRNYGQWRSNEVHIRNAERKAWKNEEKALRYNRRDNRSYGNGYQYSYYPDNGYVDQYPQHARANVLRNLIANVFGSNTGYNNNYYSQAQPVYYGNQYYPVNYGSNYYNAYPQYQSYAVTPYYYSYQPYGYAYNPQYNGDSYNADNYYYYDQQPSYYTSSNSGGGFMQQLFSKLLALGYDQGYNEGLNARRAGYGDRYYSDPYAYGNTNYVSYSNTLGQNRRCLSDGYELGYNDALYNQRGSDPYQDSNVDLVSVLIGSVLQGI